MLFWIFVALLIVGVVALIICDDDIMGAATIFAVGCLGTVASVAVLCANYIGIDGYVAENQVRYDSLMYQYKNNFYDNDNDIGKKELMSEIQDWNEDLARLKSNQRNLWIGIYIPDVYDQFDFIELHE